MIRYVVTPPAVIVPDGRFALDGDGGILIPVYAHLLDGRIEKVWARRESLA